MYKRVSGKLVDTYRSVWIDEEIENIARARGIDDDKCSGLIGKPADISDGITTATFGG